ncbi:ferric reductase transmembrane component 4 [[Candida] railenensis]|uniref:ferric-chelate reductase (NADPH) n=1 Tax=[Candida] railenensis TaxID=45579 RepID=A0A9P0QLY6_9ASCO|nr:ferric reductase transmembrane component 4 [[Candida] railenensis]
MLFKYLLSFLLLSQVVVSHPKYSYHSDAAISYYGCNYLVRETASFCGEKFAGCTCHNSYAIATIAGCLNDGKAPDGSEKAYFAYCEKYNYGTITEEMYWAAYENYTKYAVYPYEIEDYNMSVPYEVPLKLNSTLIKYYKQSYYNDYGNLRDSLYYGSGMLGYWALVFLLSGIVHWTKVLFPAFVKKFVGPISNCWRKNVTLPALFKKDKAKDISCYKVFNFLAPSRIESIIIFGFCLVTTFCSAYGLHYFDEDVLYADREHAMLKYCSDRTGIIATILVPLLILLAGRNNFLQWITGINFATFITYHKWVARVTFIEVVIHAAVWTKIFKLDNEMSEYYALNLMVWGAVATVAGGLSWILSILYLRRNWYEIFLLVHIILAVFFVVGTWYHVIDLGYLEFLYASVAVWAFDRLVRVARLIHFGCPKAEVSLLANETLKVIVRRPKFWPAIPGGHAFVHFMRPSCFWQSHPFTFTVSPDSDENIVMYCKVKGGVTHGLYQYLNTYPGKTTQIRVSLEGPYGEPTPARAYDSAVFIAGGNGIPGVYSEVLDLAMRATVSSKKALKLHWIVKDYNSIFWFYDEILALSNTKVQCTIHITREKNHFDDDRISERNIDMHTSSDDSIPNEKKSQSPNFNSTDEVNANTISMFKKDLRHVSFLESRPSIENIVKAEIEESYGSVAFVTCGHPLMVDEVRYCCAHALYDSKGKRVDFFEQLQIWA